MSSIVSIVIPTYGRPDLIRRAIKSCKEQSYGNIEIIVVDDNDPDSQFRGQTEYVMDNYRNDNQIRYIKRQVNGGGADARNTGIDVSKGKFIAFLDDDDEYKPEFVAKQLEAMQFNKVNVVVSDFERVNDRGKLIEKRERRLKGMVKYKEAARYHLLKGIDYTSSFFFSKKILTRISGFEKSFAGQESIVISKLLLLNEPIFFNPISEVIIHTHEGVQISFSKKRVLGIKKAHLYKRKLIGVLSLTERIRFLIGNNIFYLREYIRVKELPGFLVALFKILYLAFALILFNPISFVKFFKEFLKKKK